MQAIQIQRTGGPEVLVPTEVEQPQPGPGEVRIEVAAAGVNFIDVYHRTGLYPMPLPLVPGAEGAGRVGLLLAQDATRLGARLIGAVSAWEKEKLARDAGAAEIIGYDSVAEDVRRLTDGKGIPAAYDGIGRNTFDASLASLRPHGVLVLYGYSSGPVPPFDLNRLSRGGSLYVTRPTLGHFVATQEELTRRADDVLGRVADGSLSVHIGGRAPPAAARQAPPRLPSPPAPGKLVPLP